MAGLGLIEIKELAKLKFSSISLKDKDGKNHYMDITAKISDYDPGKWGLKYKVECAASTDDDGKFLPIFKGESSFSFDLTETRALHVDSLKQLEIIKNHIINVLKLWFEYETKLTRPFIIVKEYVFEDVQVRTNVGPQVTNLRCTIEKRFAGKNDIPLFEKVFLGKKDYWHSIWVIPEKPIRENRDKDYLGGFSEEGNDATHAFGVSMPEFNINDSDVKIAQLVFDSVVERAKDFDEEYKRQRNKERQKKKEPWTNRTLFRKYFENSKIGLYSAIYPFHGSDLSGWTDILSLSIISDDEDGYGFDLSILGFHFYYYNMSLAKAIQKAFVKHKPKWDRESGMTWEAYYPILKQWEKEHKFEKFLMAEWRGELGLNRARGLFWDREFEQGSSSKWGWKINPWRNKYWNII